MTMHNVPRKDAYDKEDLICCARGDWFGPGNAQLPLPPMLMFDRITTISEKGGEYEKGHVMAELLIHPDLWFFQCHFHNDPVMPGCLGVDAVWQLLGFYLAWLGHCGRGRALGSGEVRFSGQITPDKHRVVYEIDVSRIIARKLIMGIADARVACDGKVLYTVKNLKVGLFSL